MKPWLLIFALCVLCVVPARCDERIDAIVKAWTARDAKIENAKVNWRVSTTFVKGGLNLAARISGGRAIERRIDEGLQVPEQDVIVETEHSMTIKGGQFDMISIGFNGRSRM